FAPAAPDRGLAALAHGRVEPFAEVLRGDADAQALDLPAARGDVLADGSLRARRIPRILARDHLEQARRGAHVARERPDLVETRGERDEPVARNAPVRRLDPHTSSQRRGLADRASRVAAERAGREPRG